MMALLVLFAKLTFAISALVLLFRLYARWKLNYWKRLGVEQLSNSDRLFGDIKDAVLFRTSPGLHLAKLHRSAHPDAPYLGFYIFHKPCLLLRDPRIIKQIMIRDFENFTDRHFGGSPEKDSAGMRNLFGLKNPRWRYLRSKITPTLTPLRLRQMFPIMMETSEPMMRFLRTRSEQPCRMSSSIDAQDVSHKYAVDLIANVALGTENDSFTYPNGMFTKAVLNFFHGYKRMFALVFVFFIPELVELVGHSLLFNTKFISDLFWKAFYERERSGQKRGDYVDSVVQLKQGQQSDLYRFEGENLVNQSGAFLSGFESSSTAVTFTLMELAKNPSCQLRAREDVKRAIEKFGWSCEAINDMKYTEQVILEGIRLHPPVSTLDRYTLEDYRIPGTDVVLEKGTPVYVALYGLHQDPRFFYEPEVFNPDRFEEGSDLNEGYMPFGIGPRMCIATKIGLLHAKLAIARILHEFEVSVSNSCRDLLDPRSTLTSAAHGIFLNFQKISGSN